MNESDYYRVVIEDMDVKGFYENNAHTQTVDEFRNVDQLSGVPFESTDNSRTFTVNTFAVKKDGTAVNLSLADTARACYWFSTEL